MDEAEVLTRRTAAGEDPGPLAGIFFGVKDLEDVRWMVTIYGSVPFKGNIASSDSTRVDRLQAAGGIVVGKTNTPEFGFTAFTKNRLYSLNPQPSEHRTDTGWIEGGLSSRLREANL